MDIFKNPKDKVPRMTKAEMGLETFNKIFRKEIEGFGGHSTPNTGGTLSGVQSPAGPHVGGVNIRPRS
jgi:phosphoketolase